MIERPFEEPIKSIQIGRTTRSEVQQALGTPYDMNNAGEWEVYLAEGDSLALVLIVPVPEKDGYSHFLLVKYDETGRVSALGSGAAWTSSVGASYWSRSGVIVCAGGICYHPGTRRTFPSVDDGGEIDAAWGGYYVYAQYVRATSRSPALALKFLCQAAEAGHPCAPIELGKIFWGEPEVTGGRQSACYVPGTTRFVDKVQDDKLTACIWFFSATDDDLERHCRETLTPEEQRNLEEMRRDFSPKMCHQQVKPYRCGFWGDKLCKSPR